MTELFNVSFTGTLRTQSPVCIVPPNSPEIQLPDGGKYKRVFMRTIYRDGLRQTVPAVSGSTLRGRIRRSAVEAVLGLSDQKFTLGEWHQNTIGGVKGAESEDAHDILFRAKLREQNPVLALFGAGAPWMGSRALISDAMPHAMLETETVGGVRADDGRRDNGLFAKLTPEAMDDWAKLVGANAARTDYKKREKELRSALRKAKADGKTDEVKKVEAELAELSEQSSVLETNSVLMPLTHEAMPVGAELEHSMELRAVSREEAGLFAAAINHFWAEKPHVGQHANLGYGLLAGEYDVAVGSADGFDPFQTGDRQRDDLGTFKVTPFVGIENLPDWLAESMAAFRTAFDAGQYDFRVAEVLRKAS